MPIVFTSYNDDVYGGDANNSNEEPKENDWGCLIFNDSNDSAVNYAIVKYGGACNGNSVIQSVNSKIDIKNSLFEHNQSSPQIPVLKYSNSNGSEVIGNIFNHNGNGVEINGGKILVDDNILNIKGNWLNILGEKTQISAKDNIINTTISNPSMCAFFTRSPYFNVQNNEIFVNGFDGICIETNISEDFTL